MPKTSPDVEERKRRRGEDFARRLRTYVENLRREGKLDEATDGAIARATGIDRSTVTRIRDGDRAATADQILEIANALGRPELIPEEMAVGAGKTIGKPRLSAVPATLPPGLEGFLERHGKRLGITRRERAYLEADRTQTEAWLVKDDGHWERRLKFWRSELAIQDKASGIPGQDDPE